MTSQFGSAKATQIELVACSKFDWLNDEPPFCGDGIAVHRRESLLTESRFHSTDSTVCPRPKPKRKSPPGSKKKVSARKPSITNCATGCSAVSVTGASRSRLFGKKTPDGNLYHEALPESALPLLPPSLEDYKPTADGQPPLARAKDWVNLPDGSVRETNTMPQWAGSCWYYLRYLDAKNQVRVRRQRCGELLDGRSESEIRNPQSEIANARR